MPARSVTAAIGDFFDILHHFWESEKTERRIGFALLWIYLSALACVELGRAGLLPAGLPLQSHYYSIQLAFTLILALEVVSLIFVLPASLSKSMGKQLEILTLILLRNAFKELSIMPEPVSVDFDNLGQLIDIGVSGTGALIVFLCLGFYRGMVRRQRLFLRDHHMLVRYVLAKKLLSVCLLAIFTGIAVYDLPQFADGKDANFFETIYTVLIFADIAMVLIAQRFMPSYYAVFRNSGYVIGTLMMRISLSAPALLCSGIAVFAAIYVLALTWGTNIFRPDAPPGPGSRQQHGHKRRRAAEQDGPRPASRARIP